MLGTQAHMGFLTSNILFISSYGNPCFRATPSLRNTHMSQYMCHGQNMVLYMPYGHPSHIFGIMFFLLNGSLYIISKSLFSCGQPINTPAIWVYLKMVMTWGIFGDGFLLVFMDDPGKTSHGPLTKLL